MSYICSVIKHTMIDLTQIHHISFDNIDYSDYPDFTDAYPSKVEYLDPVTNQVRELTDEEMTWFTDRTDFWWPTLYQNAIEGLFI